MPKCQVIDPAFSWGDDRNPRTPWHDTVIYEMHVRGFTKLQQQVPPQYRGTYAGSARRRSSSICSAWASRRSS
jgi:glycogen operon protein